MRLRTFTAPTMKEALAEVKAALGEDALILSSEEHKNYVNVIAAVDADSIPLQPEKNSEKQSKISQNKKYDPSAQNEREIDNLRFDVQNILRFHNLPELFIAKISAVLSDATIASILAKGRMNIANEKRYFLELALEYACKQYFNFIIKSANKTQRIMLLGASGTGKTLAIAKLATSHALSGKKPLVITTDINRAGAVDQLQSFTDILGVKLIICSDKKSLSSTLKMADEETNILIDSAGCNPYSAKNIEELKQLAEIASSARTELSLVIPAGIDTQEAIDITELFCELPIKSLIATRLDCSRRLGGLLSAAASNLLPFFLSGNSDKVTDNMNELTAKNLVECLLRGYEQ